MARFANTGINRVNLHYAVQQLAQGAGGVFILVYLLRAGVALPLTFCAMAALLAGRFVLRPAVLPVAQRTGIRTTLVLGTFLDAGQFLFLPFVKGPGLPLLGMIVAGAIGGVFYWTSYHAYFAALGEAEHRGDHVGAREAIVAVVGIVSPLLGAWALVRLGAMVAFACVAAVQSLSALPLLGAPQVPVRLEAPGGFRAARLGAALMATDGWFAASFVTVWDVALFLTLGGSFAAYGAAMALGGLVGAASSLGMGRLVDLGHGRRAVFVASGISAAVLVLRAAAYGSPVLATIANALGPVAVATRVPVVMSRLYNLAKSSPCPMRFHMATEGGWDLGCGTGCLAAAGLAWAGLPLSVPVLAGLAGVAAMAIGLLRSYAASEVSAG